ncbi:Hypothetical protein A7982_11801 [Minicystis rosea]|nr:Hypothetical protein A7982_11801 [Minicystis rosea]
MTSGDDLFRAWPDLLRLPAGAQAELVYEPFGRAGHVLSAERARVLATCRGLATLDQHAGRIAAQVGRAAAAVRVDLAELVAAGLLVSAGALLRRIAEAAPRTPEEPPRIATLGIATRDRLPDVRAALESYLVNARDHGRTLEIVVAEGAVSEATREATRADLVALASRYGAAVFHAGMPEREAYAATLAARAGVPLDVVRFALLNPEGFPQDTGAGRNAILLHAAGELHVQVDDDTRCRLAPAPGRVPGLSLTSQHDPTESWFPAAGEPALPERVRVDRCYLAVHEELLGRNVAACADGARRQGLEVERASSAFFRRLSPAGGRVLATMTGSAGDTGTGSMWHYLLFGGRTRERLLASEDHYRRAFTSRQAVRAVPRAAVSDGIFCMSMSLGLDGRELLPPFLPVQRNSDGVHAFVVRMTQHGAFTGFLPWVIEHSPSRPRTSSFADFFASLGRTASEDMLCGLIATSGITPDPNDSRVALRALGATLARWGNLAAADFDDVVRTPVLRARSLDAQLLEEALLAHRGAPAFWARDVERAAAALQAALPRAAEVAPIDLTAAFGVEDGKAAMRRMVRGYGVLLECWPEIWEAAKALRAEGTRPGARVA